MEIIVKMKRREAVNAIGTIAEVSFTFPHIKREKFITKSPRRNGMRFTYI